MPRARSAADWSAVLPPGVSPREVLGFDPETARPASWPLRYGMVSWSAAIRGLAPGAFEVRARAVDLNGYAQPEPRPLRSHAIGECVGWDTAGSTDPPGHVAAVQGQPRHQG